MLYIQKKMQLWDKVILPAILLVILDSIFIGSQMAMFSRQIYDVQHSKLEINIVGAILSYIFLVFALYYFILREHRSVYDAMLLGLVIYGVYETTTYALLKKWRVQTMIYDTLWGSVLFGLTTFLTYKLTSTR